MDQFLHLLLLVLQFSILFLLLYVVDCDVVLKQIAVSDILERIGPCVRVERKHAATARSGTTGSELVVVDYGSREYLAYLDAAHAVFAVVAMMAAMVRALVIGVLRLAATNRRASILPLLCTASAAWSLASQSYHLVYVRSINVM